MIIYLTGPLALNAVVVERQGRTEIAIWTRDAEGRQRAAAWCYPDTEEDADELVAAWVEAGAEADPSWSTEDDGGWDGWSEDALVRAERQQMGICG